MKKKIKKIKTFKDACRVLNIKTHGDAFRILKLDRKLCANISIDKCDDDVLKLMIITKALNGVWIPDWDKLNQFKYWPRFNMGYSGFGFLHVGYDLWNKHTAIGSRLCFKSSKLAQYAGKKFQSIYKNFLVIK